MMRLVAFLRGHCRLEITGVEPSRCLNRFLRCGVGFWDLATPDAYTLQCSVLTRDLAAAVQTARGCQCQARCLARHGFAHRYGGLVRRPMLLVSLALLLAGILVLPNFIWTLEVQGNVTVPTAQILQELDNIGVRFGTWGPGLSNREIKNKMLLRIPALQWLAVNCSGGRATVLVSERTEADRVTSKREVTNLVAARDGVISQVQVYSGAAQCTPGQAVRQGQLLVSGYCDWDGRIQATRAYGEIYAQTQHKITAKLPAAVAKKQPGGRAKRCIWLNLGRKRIKIFGRSGISAACCDKIESEKMLTLPGGYTLPIGITVQTFRPYTPEQATLAEEDAWPLLRDAARRQLQASMIAGQLESAREEKEAAGGVYTLRTTAWCREMIARSEPAALYTEEASTYGTGH